MAKLIREDGGGHRQVRPPGGRAEASCAARRVTRVTVCVNFGVYRYCTGNPVPRARLIFGRTWGTRPGKTPSYWIGQHGGASKMKAPVLVLLALLLLVAPAVSQTPDDKLIMPGVRIGKWTLAMKIDDLVRMNGPAQIVPIVGGTAPVADTIHDYTIFLWNPLDLGAFTFDRKKVEVLGTGALMNYKTAKGIGLKSTRSETVATYGKPTAETIPRDGLTHLIYEKFGISFLFFNTGQIRNIYVFRPGTAKTFWKF